MKYRFALFAVLTIVASIHAYAGSLPIVKAEDVGMSTEMLQRLDRKFQQLVDDETSAGFQVLIARRGSVVSHKSYGVANIDSGNAITEDTLFRIYSMTKPLVGAAMMILYEEGRFSLSDPIAKYIPAFEGIQVYTDLDDEGELLLEDAARPPSIHDLLQHSAGFTYGIFSDTPVDKLYLDADIFDINVSLETFIDKLASIPLLYQPGSRYHYSVAVDVQGYLIERLSGMEASAFIQERILDPLGMDETMTWVPADKAALLSKVHTHNDEGKLVVYSDDPESGFSVDSVLEKPVMFSGGAQLISTADDYWRFAQMMLDGGSLDGARILSKSSVQMMTSNRLPETVEGRRIAPGQGAGFNLGVITDQTLINYPVSNGEFSHGGMATTHFWVDPEKELVVIFLSQYLPWSNPPYVDLVHRMVHDSVID